MTARFIAWARQQPVFAFYLLAFAITWMGWLPQAAYSHGLFPFNSFIFYVFGGIGPMAAAYIVLYALYGKDEAVTRLFAPLLRWRVGFGWYVVALVGSAVGWTAANAMRGELALMPDKLGPLPALVPAFLTYCAAAIPEELAWRGFALPRFQERSGSALVASLIIGVLSAVWHLPLLLVRDSVMSTYPLAPYLLYVVLLSVIYAWMFNSTGGSALILVIFHAGTNTFGNFLGLEQTAVTLVLATLLVLVFGAARLRRSGGVKAEKPDILSPV